MGESHITVKAQGGLTEDKYWIPAVEDAVKKYPAFDVSFIDAGNFEGRAAFLVPSSTKEIMGLHNILLEIIKPSSELLEKYFEGEKYFPHLTLAGTAHGIMSEELISVEEKARAELLSLPKFTVSFIRVYEEKDSNGPYEKFYDVFLKIS